MNASTATLGASGPLSPLREEARGASPRRTPSSVPRTPSRLQMARGSARTKGGGVKMTPPSGRRSATLAANEPEFSVRTTRAPSAPPSVV